MKIFRFILFIVHLVILFLLLGTLLNAYIPPKVFPWVNLLSLGFPILIILYIIFTLFWIFSWKKRAFLFLACSLFFVKPVLRWVNFSSEKKETADLKIVTFNIKSGQFGKEKIENYINSLNADIVLLQEYGVIKFNFNNLKRVHEMPVVAMYSKYKVVDHKEIIVGDYDYFNAYVDQTDLEIRGKIYRFINIYLQPYKFEKSMVKLNGNSSEDEQKVKDIVKRLIPTFKNHQEQIAIIRESIDHSPYPIILTGDFNAVPNSYEYYHLLKNLKDAFVVSGSGSATSFHDYKFPIRIDYVFISPSIKVVSYKVDRSVNISDHYPVVSTLKLAD